MVTGVYLDITDYIDYKIRAMKAHKFQLEWLRGTKLHGFDPLERIRI